MSRTRRRIGSLGLAVAYVWLGWAAPVRAQEDPAVEEPRRLQLFTDFDFHLAIAHLGSDDEQFVWDGDYGGDIDVLDYGVGRVNFLANYEAMVGEQLRRFDVNQGNYTLDISGSVRVADLELIGVFHHISRNLSDRRKTFAIDWNMVGVQVMRPLAIGQTAVEVHGRALWTVKRSFVDYRAEYGGDVRLRHTVRPSVSVIGSAGVTLVPVDSTVFGRGRQTGASLEGGVRIDGSAAALEFFVAFERRIDASPFDLTTRNLGLVGFRLLSQ